MFVLLALALVVGIACGAALSFEMHAPEVKRNSWRQWAHFVAAAAVVSLAMVAAGAVNDGRPAEPGRQGLVPARGGRRRRAGLLAGHAQAAEVDASRGVNGSRRGPGAATTSPASQACPASRESRAWRLYPALAVAWSLSACVYVPRTIEVYDADCRVTSRHLVLQPVQLAAVQSCSNSGCASLLVAAGATAAASAVISGSIVIVGNMVYWFEKQGSCRGPGPAAPGRLRAD